jgi:hypothetical protein
MNKRHIALVTGWSLIIMAVISGFSFGYAFPKLYQPTQIDLLKGIILSDLGLYRNMLIGIMIILLLDLLVSFTLYNYFKTDNKKLAFISGVFRGIYALIFGIAAFYLMKNLRINELTNQVASTNYNLFQTIWNCGLIIFGVHLFLIGILMKIHKRIFKILWYMIIIAGISYIILHILKVTIPDSDFVRILNMVLTLPMAIGELGLAIWLVIKGGKENK